ncbi:hypothetical protein TNCV_1806401 [Trichonephila clavipes]|nr:hypothetical protein TNCV_1806401 [Trichonephila clavipes]
MAGEDTTTSKTDQRAVIKFLTLEGCKPVSIRKWLCTVPRRRGGRKCLATIDKGFATAGQVHKVVIEKLITEMDTAIKENRRRNICDVTDGFSISIYIIHNIITTILKYLKFCLKWELSMIFEHHKKQ